MPCPELRTSGQWLWSCEACDTGPDGTQDLDLAPEVESPSESTGIKGTIPASSPVYLCYHAGASSRPSVPSSQGGACPQSRVYFYFLVQTQGGGFCQHLWIVGEEGGRSL